MTDYFALLEQPRHAWLDAEKLQEIFHAKARGAQPDAELNEAYKVLRDPKRRLHHLLALSGQTPSSAQANVPRDVEELFPAVAALTKDADVVVEKLSKAISALSRSLLKTEIATVEQQITQMLAKIAEMKNAALVRLQAADETNSGELHALYLQFSYLNRWIEQLEERQLQLRL